MSDIETATFESLKSLIALITNPKACEARALDLQRQTDQLRDQQAKHAGEVEALNRRAAALDARSTALDERERTLRRRLAELMAREHQAKEAAAIRAGKIHDYRGDDSIAGSNFSRELS